MAKLSIKRVYESPDKTDGQRVLVDRVWPRGISKVKLGDAHWLKDIAPSATLRQWFGHKPARWTEFRKRYFAELDRAEKPIETLRGLLRKGPVTLLYGAKDMEHNQAVALVEYLKRRP